MPPAANCGSVPVRPRWHCQCTNGGTGNTPMQLPYRPNRAVSSYTESRFYGAYKWRRNDEYESKGCRTTLGRA